MRHRSNGSAIREGGGQRHRKTGTATHGDRKRQIGEPLGEGRKQQRSARSLLPLCVKTLHANGAKVRSTSPNGKRQVYPSRKWGRGVGHEQE